MKIKTILINIFFLSLLLLTISTKAKTQSENSSHLGPTINATVQRGKERLPIYLVNHLLKGDKVLVTSDQEEKTNMKWMILLATVTPISNIVETRQFDLSQGKIEASIDIKADDQIPIIVIAPQVRTVFGLHTSFSESASLISEAIKSDPQRFMDLQKIDQINHAVTYLSTMLDTAIQSNKPDQATSVTKSIAAKFGIKYINPDCFKDDAVNTKCVANDIISSEDLTIPSGDVWTAAGPNASSVSMPTDIFASLKLITETSTYLINKYGDNYDFAPSLGQRVDSIASIQLHTNARFRNGDVKTAYVYVPSWFDAVLPELHIDTKQAPCLAANELKVNVKGKLPFLNYWHNWNLVIFEHGETKPIAQYNSIEFKPDSGKFSFDFQSSDLKLPMNGQSYDAKISGKFGFSDIALSSFTIVLPTNEPLLGQISGLDNLFSGEQSQLNLKGKNANACVESMTLFKNGKNLGTNASNNLPLELNVDLKEVPSGIAKLNIQQYGVQTQEVEIPILKPRARIKNIIHYDLENDIAVNGDNLDRIEFVQLTDNLTCPLSDKPNLNESENLAKANSRNFTCPDEFASNDQLPKSVSIKYKDNDKLSSNFPLIKMNARPHMLIDGDGAIITRLSPAAIQWNLRLNDHYLTEDSGTSLLLHAVSGYKLAHGTYLLQIKFLDDPQTEDTPISIVLMSDVAHNELRTKKPINFTSVTLPSIVNPILYRVIHQPSGLAGNWQALNRSVIYLPQLTSLSCDSKSTLIHGSQLELIDWASNNVIEPGTNSKSNISQCENEQCLEINEVINDNKLKIKLHWIEDRIFDVTFPTAPTCSLKN